MTCPCSAGLHSRHTTTSSCSCGCTYGQVAGTVIHMNSTAAPKPIDQLAMIADDNVIAAVVYDEANNYGRWIPDPSVPNVWGFEVADKIVLVLYLGGELPDFECSEDWMEAHQ